MTVLTATDLFTPATADDYVAKMLSIGSSLGLKTTAWQPGGVTRTILAVVANMLAAADQVISVFAQGGYLDTAAAVTPEGGPGWLDVLAKCVFDEERTAATYASGNLSIVNASASVYGPFDPGTYHVANPTTHATYVNRDALTIGASGTTTAAFVADAAGSPSTSAASGITQTISSLIGVTVTNAAAFVGTDADTNAQLVEKCRLKLATFSARTGPDDAYVYFAKNADKYLAAGTALAGGKITRAKVATDPLTGTVTVTIANGGGAPVGGDVTKVDGVIQAECVPDAVTEVTQAATNLVVTVALDVWVPSAKAGAAATALALALPAFVAAQPIGGVVGSVSGILSFNALEGAIFQAVPYLTDSTLTINGVATDLAVGATQVPTYGGGSVVTIHSV